MAIAGVGVCLHCEAVVNLHWSRCAVCDRPIESRRDQPARDQISVGTAEVGENVQTAFSLNTGSIRNSSPVRDTLYEPGQVVEIDSPMFGIFQAEVLRDNGTILWVWHPFLEREVAIPNQWLIGEGQSR